MKEAIGEYQKLGQDKLADLGLTNNLAFALFYGGDYAGACKSAQDLNPQPKALLAACVAMLQDSKAGLAEAANAQKMKLSAAALLASTKPTAAKGLQILEDARKDAATDREKTSIDLALVLGYDVQNNYEKLLAVSSLLLQQVPESKIAFLENTQSLTALGRYDEAMALADQRLKLLDGDADALRAKMAIASARGDYAAARGWAQKLVDQGKQDANLLNSIAWFSLFTGKVRQSDIAAAIKATQMDRDDAAILHTLACLYAETGQTKDAHDLLLRGMDDLNLEQPDDDYWYAFGRIAEQYGENQVAIDDYRKLEKPRHVLALSTSGYLLAQRRLKTLGADTTAVAGK